MSKNICIKLIYAVHQGDDDRSMGSPAFFFEARTDAEKCADGRGWYGGNAPISERDALIIDGEAYLLARPKPIQLNFSPDDLLAKKNAAKAKLTKEEQKLLGIA